MATYSAPDPLDESIGTDTGIITTHSDEFDAVGGVTAYSAFDRIAASASNSGTVPLRKLLTCRKNGASGIIKKLRLQFAKTGLVGVVRIHLYTLAAPPTAIPGDNAAFPVVYANRASRIGYIDMPALVAPGGTGSDVSFAQRDIVDFVYKCAAADKYIYYALEDRTGMTLDASTHVFIAAETDDN